jgi:hypothetical protein
MDFCSLLSLRKTSALVPGLEYSAGSDERNPYFMKILVVDDHVLIRGALRGLLQESRSALFMTELR